jgi:hypothetical protein
LYCIIFISRTTYTKITSISISIFVSLDFFNLKYKTIFFFYFICRKTDRIIIRCNTPEFVAQIDEYFLGKQNHLSSVVTELATRKNKTIKPSEILLLDDDVQNILIAEEFGHKVLEIRDEINLDILKDFVYNILPDS